ncbi:MAG TPA: zf-HC2 domain-containing protein, partial [Terriglobia bacterium]|nr:zf-HC2 domain-containing protein [Terriglobia bacterium]
MNCELAQERMVTAAYGELSDELVHELERHLVGCEHCQVEREHVMALKLLADVHPVIEPDPNLIARAHLRLDEVLDALPPKRWYERLGERMLSNFASLQAAPVASVLLLVAGAGAGLL